MNVDGFARSSNDSDGVEMQSEKVVEAESSGSSGSGTRIEQENAGVYQDETCYPYTGSRTPCNNNPSCNYKQTKLTKWEYSRYLSEDEIKELVYTTAVATVVQVKLLSLSIKR